MKTTITFDSNSPAGRRVLEAIRNLPPELQSEIHFEDSAYPTGCAEVGVAYGQIPGFAYTKEERLGELEEAEAEDPSQAMTHEDFLREMQTWK